MLLGGIFIYAALLKINAPQDLADAIASYQLVPKSLMSPVALGLPLFELLCGLTVVTGYFRASGLIGIIGMLCAFLLGLDLAIIRGLPVTCGCYGAHSLLDLKPPMAVERDVALLLVAAYAYEHDCRQPRQAATKELSQSGRRDRSPGTPA